MRSDCRLDGRTIRSTWYTYLYRNVHVRAPQLAIASAEQQEHYEAALAKLRQQLADAAAHGADINNGDDSPGDPRTPQPGYVQRMCRGGRVGEKAGGCGRALWMDGLRVRCAARCAEAGWLDGEW
eukprot:363553-Chlamydomonas_euryale.AAC.4